MDIRFHHLHLLCSDVERSRTFFTQALGAVDTGPKSFGGAAGHTLELDGMRVYLREAKPGEDPEPGDGLARCGYHHIAVAAKDVDALCLRLERHGAVVTAPPRQTPSGRVAFVQGPDRIHIECYDPVENQA